MRVALFSIEANSLCVKDFVARFSNCEFY